MSTLLDLMTPKGGDNSALRFLTSVRFQAGLLRAINNITFLFDANWNPDIYGQSTLPISFFFVKKHTELMNTEVGKKKVLLYNTLSGSAGSESATGGLINVIADNIVIEPKTYKLDVLVPFHADDLLNQYQYDADTVTKATSFMLGGSLDSLGLTTTLKVSTLLLKAVFTALCGTTLSVSGIINSILNQNDYNKESLEAMWKNRCVLKMKMWNGWQFKYVAITNIELSKSGDTEGFYEGSITVQEMPILMSHPKEQAVEATKKIGLIDRSFLMSKIKSITEEKGEEGIQ